MCGGYNYLSPALAALRRNRGGKRMQFDAIAHAGLKMAENRGKTHKKTGFSVPVSNGLLAANCADNAR